MYGTRRRIKEAIAAATARVGTSSVHERLSDVLFVELCKRMSCIRAIKVRDWYYTVAHSVREADEPIALYRKQYQEFYDAVDRASMWSLYRQVGLNPVEVMAVLFVKFVGLF